MARPPLPIGTWGAIRRKEVSSRQWVAYARFRDYDGVTRIVERAGASGAKAETTLKEALLERARVHGDDINADSRVKTVAEQWFQDEIAGAKAYNTERRYREVLDLMVLPGMGMLALREVSVARCDRFLKTTANSHGPSAAKHAKTVLSGVLGLATRLGALGANPIRDVAPVRVQRKEVEALSLSAVQAMRVQLYADADAVARDIPHGVDFMLGTSARIGEALAIRWRDLDLDAPVPTVSIRATVIFVKGRGMIIQEHPKTSSSRRVVPLPEFVARSLRIRKLEARHPDLVFASARAKVRDPNNFRKGWDAFKMRAGYEWVHPHVFRKTAAALVKDPELAAGLLGHADSRVTKAHYLPRTTLAPDVRDLLEAMGARPSDTHRNQREVTPITGKNRASVRAFEADQTA
ncbi:site-specific integrase [Microbacterium aoyamense]|uniref:Site-specific integrase n=1 Tax=Microbacterium aoyamense TaxID=344166 RepID=A0ABP5AIC9_9MICO